MIINFYTAFINSSSRSIRPNSQRWTDTYTHSFIQRTTCWQCLMQALNTLNAQSDQQNKNKQQKCNSKENACAPNDGLQWQLFETIWTNDKVRDIWTEYWKYRTLLFNISYYGRTKKKPALEICLRICVQPLLRIWPFIKWLWLTISCSEFISIGFGANRCQQLEKYNCSLIQIDGNFIRKKREKYICMWQMYGFDDLVLFGIYLAQHLLDQMTSKIHPNAMKEQGII